MKRQIEITLVLAVVYFFAAEVSLIFFASIYPDASPIWPPTGIALAAVLLYGYGVWPGIFLGAFLAHGITDPAISLGVAAGNSLGTLSSAVLINRYAGGKAAFSSLPNIGRFVIFAAIGATASGTMCVISHNLGGAGTHEIFWPMWRTSWLGRMAGAAIFAPLIVLWMACPCICPRERRREFVWLLAFCGFVTFIVFGSFFHADVKNYPVAFLCILPVAWAAYRFGTREAMTVVFLLSSAGIFATIHGYGPFVLGTMNDSLLPLQSFMGVLAVGGLALGVLAAAERRLLREVEERKRCEGEARETARQLAESQKIARIGSWEWEIATKRVEWSEELYRIFGFTPETFSPSYKNFLSRVHQEDLAGTRAVLDEAFRKKLPFHYVHRIVLPDGSVRVVEELGQLIDGANAQPLRMAGTCQDVTEAKELEAELETFHSLITHDLSNATISIIGFVERLLTHPESSHTPKEDELLHRIARQGYELNRLAENAKLLVRLRSDQGPVSAERVVLAKVFGDVIKSVRSVHFDLDFEYDVDCPPDLAVSGIPFLHNVILNLVDNAVKHTPRERPGRVRIRAVGASDGVDVWITGGELEVGLEPSSLFKRYVKGKDSRGSGLGLSLVRGVIRRIGGRVEASRVKQEAGEEVFEVFLHLPSEPSSSAQGSG